MKKRSVMKRLTALFMAGGLFLTGIPALFVRAEGENYPVYAAVKNYCDLSGNSFTVTDVRTKETKTFDGSAGRNAVFIYGQFGYTYTEEHGGHYIGYNDHWDEKAGVYHD